jgi:hypothetical protein
MTHWLAAAVNLSALAHLPGPWMDLVHGRRLPRGILLDIGFEREPDPAANRR